MFIWKATSGAREMALMGGFARFVGTAWAARATDPGGGMR